MGFFKVAAGGIAAVFVAGMVAGGVKGCVADDHAEGSTTTQNFTDSALQTGGEMASSTGSYIKRKAEDPATQQAIRDGTRTTVDFAKKSAISIMDGITDAIEEEPRPVEQAEVVQPPPP